MCRNGLCASRSGIPHCRRCGGDRNDKEIRLSCTDTCVAVINKETGALTFEGDGEMVQGYDMKVRFSDYSDYIRKVTLKAGMFEPKRSI